MLGINANLQTVRKRRQAIEKLFKPLARKEHVTVFEQSTVTSFALGLGHPVQNLRNARHPTVRSELFLNYFEVWDFDGDDSKLSLNKAYLHVHLANSDGSADEEVLALHSDPRIPTTDPAFKYKRGPHLHISSAKGELSKCHIALSLTDTDRVCGDLGAFSSALTSAVTMIKDEFFFRL